MMKVILIVALCVLGLSDFGSTASLGPFQRGIRSANESSSTTPSPASVTEAIADKTTAAPAEASTTAQPAAPTQATSTAQPPASEKASTTVKEPSPAEASTTEVSSTTSAAEVSSTAAAGVSSTAAPSSTTTGAPEAAAASSTASPVEASSSEATPQSAKSEPEISTSLVKEEPRTQSAETTPIGKDTPNPVPETVSENQENRLDVPTPEQPAVQPTAATEENVKSVSLAVPTTPIAVVASAETPVAVSAVVIPEVVVMPADEVPAPQTALLEKDPPAESSNTDFVVVPAQDIRVDGVTVGSVVSDGVPQSPEQSVETVSTAAAAAADVTGNIVVQPIVVDTSSTPVSVEPKTEVTDANKVSDASSPATEASKATTESVAVSSPVPTPVTEKTVEPKSESKKPEPEQKVASSSEPTSAAPAAQEVTTPAAVKTTEEPASTSTEGAKNTTEAEKPNSSSTPSPKI